MLVGYNADEVSVPGGSRFESGVVGENLLLPHFENEEEMVSGMGKNKGTFRQTAW